MCRVGFGYDSHRFSGEGPLVLCGLRIADQPGLIGHSDADAALHAITDAILGAIAAGDIGEHFPDTDPQWAGAANAQFVRHAAAVAKDKNYKVVNCDVTILAQKPKLTPYKQQMRENIAGLLEIESEAVSVKAKTNEGMGLIGRGEGIAALAIVLLESPQ